MLCSYVDESLRNQRHSMHNHSFCRKVKATLPLIVVVLIHTASLVLVVGLMALCSLSILRDLALHCCVSCMVQL